MCSRRPRGDRRKAGAILLAILLASGTASAETFRYVDRQGHSHTMEVSEDVTPAPTAAPSPPAVDDQSSAVPMGELPYLAYAKRASETYLVPLELVLAVMKVESGFNPHAISNKGALGLMQLMPTTAADLGVVDPFDPAQNIDGGVRYLHTLLDGFSGDVEPALAAYHGNRILTKIGGYLPGARGAALSRLTLGFRPMPLDEFPVVGALTTAPDVYVAVTHSGVTLAPILGQTIRDEVLGAARMDILAPYRPERFPARSG